jgi:hypothetical protein
MMLRSLANGQGYFFSDNRCSGGVLEEDDLIGCGHCPISMKKKEWNNNGGYRCVGCDRCLCPVCAAAPPQMKCLGTDADRIERALNDLHRKQQNALILGI